MVEERGGTLGDSLRRRRRRRKGRVRRGRSDVANGTSPRRGVRWGRWILGGLGAIGLAFLVGYLVALFVLFPVPADASLEGVPVPDLVGDDLQEAELELREVGLRLGTVTEIAAEEGEAGAILAQGSLAGQRLPDGASIDVAVAVRQGAARVPPVVGLGVDAATEILRMAGLETQRRAVQAEAVGGRVVGTDPVAGSEIGLPGPVTLLVAAGAAPLPQVEPLTPLGEPLEEPSLEAPLEMPAPGAPPDTAAAAPSIPPDTGAVRS